MKSRLKQSFLALLTGAFLILGTAPACLAQWDGLLVDLSNCVAIGTQIAVDRDDWAHIVHYDRTHQSLKYTRFDGFHWHGALIDTERDAGQGPDIDVDSSNRGHISYRRNGNLMYVWTEGRVASAPEKLLDDTTWGNTALAVDLSGNPHIALNTDQGLTYLHRAGGQWHIERLGAFGTNPDLALGPDGTPHISWIGENSGQGWGRLYYSRKHGATWSHQPLDSQAHVSGDTAIAVDRSGRVRVIYLDWLDNLLKEAFFDNAAWTFSTLAVNADRDRGLDLALDQDDRPHVAYTATGPTRTAKYGYLDDELGWVFEVINDGAGPCLDIDTYNRPHTAFSQTAEKRVPEPWPIPDCEVLYYSFRR